MAKFGIPLRVSSGYLPVKDKDFVQIDSTSASVRMSIQQAELFIRMQQDSVDDAKMAQKERLKSEG